VEERPERLPLAGRLELLLWPETLPLEELL
jgi:hypothetical protein